MKRLLTLFASTLFFASCSTTKYVYQVFQTQSKDVNYNSKRDDYIFEDANVTIDYNFWSDGGEMYFKFYNKSDKPIYVDLNKSHLIHNGEVYDYYSETIKTNSNESFFAKTASYSLYRSALSGTSGFKTESGTAIKSKSIVQIPPRSYSVFKFYKLMIAPVSNCGVLYVAKGEPQKKTYDDKNSPLTFRNYLSYDFNESITNPIVVDNSFWIDEVYFMQEKLYKGSGSYEKGCADKDSNYVYSYPFWKNKNFYYKIAIPK